MTCKSIFCSILVLVTFTSLSCNVFDSREPEPPGFENEFTFELNGEPFWGELRAVITNVESVDLLDFYGIRFDSSRVPYLHQISLE